MSAFTSAEAVKPSKPTMNRCPTAPLTTSLTPSRLRTASFTRLPSAVVPPAASAASAAFITLPMSLGEVAPVSATAFSTAAAISSSVTSAGR